MENLIIDPEFKELIPPLMTEDYQKLEESIVAEGCRDALVVWNNTLIDGHNRYEICQKHSLPFKTTEMQFNSRNEAMLWMINNQLARRNLSAADRIILAGRQRPILEQIAKDRQSAAGGDRKSEEYKIAVVKSDKSDFSEETSDFSKLSKTEQELAINKEVQEALDDVIGARFGQSYDEFKDAITPEEKKKIHVRDEIAKLACVSSGTVAKFEKIQKQKPELIEEIRTHKMSIDKAYQTMKDDERKKKQEEAIQAQIEQPKTSAHIDIYTTENKYRVVYADPPWSYNDKQNSEKLGGAEKHYPTMSIKELCELPVPTEDNAVLFLWVTSPLLDECFKVIDAWGFEYKSSFVWDKVKHNMGHYNSVRHEFLLVCTKGRCTPDVQKLYDSVISIERTEHSKKPNEFREIIDTLYPIGKRLEMFAREASDGWDVWGNMA